jgi:hypothetical protein
VAQLASSLVAALDVLHTHGFIHEHIAPRNIFAIGEVVKLRGDCIREAPEGEEGRALKQRDVHDLATVLLQALTQRESVEGIPDSAMPPPFGQIIRNGLNGTWGLGDIRAALGRQFGANQPTAPALQTAAPEPSAVTEQKPGAAAKRPVRPEAQRPLPLRSQGRNPRFAGATPRKDTWSKDSWGDAENFDPRSRWIGAGGAALLLLLCSWIVAHAWSEHQHQAAQAAATSQPAPQPSATSANPVVASPAPQPAAANLPSATLPTSAGPRANWRVITFTYNRRADADKKVSDLARSHPELQPVVFTPSGHAPFLVSIGGLMDRDAAYALAHRSRALGLPHDMYAQNYSR